MPTSPWLGVVLGDEGSEDGTRRDSSALVPAGRARLAGNLTPKLQTAKCVLKRLFYQSQGERKIHVGIQKVPSPLPSKQLPSNCHNFGSRGVFAEGPAFYTVALLRRLCSKHALITL